MRILIAAACVAIVAAVGYYFVQEYRSAKANEALASAREYKARCDETLKRVTSTSTTDADATYLANCLLNGAVTQAELDAAKKK
jgi:hypothetical protein